MWLDLDAWPRRAHFDLFRSYEIPFFGLVAPVDVTATRAWCRAHDASFFLACWYAALDVVNGIEPLRMRLRGDRVWVHERLAIGSTVLATDETFRFAYLEAAPSFRAFAAAGRVVVDEAKSGPPRLATADRDDLVHGTVVVPWVAFTAVTHAKRFGLADSVPRIAIGRIQDVGGRLTVPVGVEAHHALVDGLHVGRFYEGFAARLADPERTFGGS